MPSRLGPTHLVLSGMVIAALLATPGTGSAVTFQHLATYVADTTADNDRFGNSVALDGGVALIGASLSPRGIIDGIAMPPGDPRQPFGAAFVFDTSTHELVDTITAADFGPTNGFFGDTVAAHNGIAVIGDSIFFQGIRAGSTASVYDLRNRQPLGVLNAPQGPGFSDVVGFGNQLALNDSTIFVGHQQSVGIPNPESLITGGSVHAFRSDDLSPAGDLSPEATPRFLRFGAAVAASNDYAVVGAISFPTLYVYDAVTQDQIHEIDLSSCDCLRAPAGGDDLRMSVDIDGDLAVVGYADFNRGSNALVVDLVSGEVVRELIPETPFFDSDFANLGFSVAIDDGIAAIGAPFLSGGFDPAGGVLLFDVATGEQLAQVDPVPTPGFNPSLFGISVDLEDDLLLVGALRGGQFTGNGPFGHGGAQLFRLVPEPTGAALVATLMATFASHRRRV